MFISKQFRNFVHSKSVYSVFRDCIFEVTRVNSVQISFSILKISPKKCVAHLKLGWVRSNRNAKDFSRKCRQIVYCVKTAFAGKLLATKFCKVCHYIFRCNFFSAKCVALKLLRYFKSSTVQQSLVIKNINALLQLQADFAISHSYITNAYYSPHSACFAA